MSIEKNENCKVEELARLARRRALDFSEPVFFSLGQSDRNQISIAEELSKMPVKAHGLGFIFLPKGSSYEKTGHLFGGPTIACVLDGVASAVGQGRGEGSELVAGDLARFEGEVSVQFENASDLEALILIGRAKPSAKPKPKKKVKTKPLLGPSMD